MGIPLFTDKPSNLALAQNALSIAQRIYNPQGLRRWAAALSNVDTVVPTIWCAGDSLVWGTGFDGTNNNTDEAGAIVKSWPGRLQQLFARHFGNDCGYIGAGSVATDSRVTLVNATSASTSIGALGKTVTSTGSGSVTFAVPACTDLDIIYMSANAENGQPTSGNFAYEVDSGGEVAQGGAEAFAYRVKAVTGLTKTTHTVAFRGKNTNLAFCAGLRYKSTPGVVVGRFGRPGWTSSDILGLAPQNPLSAAGQARVLKAFGMGSPNLVIILLGYNDWGQQEVSGYLTTPAVYKTNIQAMVTEVVNAGGCVLLVGNPDSPSVSTPGPAAWTDYWKAAKEVADENDHVSQVLMSDINGTYTEALALGLTNSGSVHQSAKGYAHFARGLFNLLMSQAVLAETPPLWNG